MTRRGINTEIEKRWYVWHCRRASPEKRRFVAPLKRLENGKVAELKEPCGLWQATATRKWQAGRKDSRWQVKCKCGKKRSMNLGECLPEDGRGYTSREEAEAVAEKQNEYEEHRQAIESQHEDWYAPDGAVEVNL